MRSPPGSVQGERMSETQDVRTEKRPTVPIDAIRREVERLSALPTAFTKPPRGLRHYDCYLQCVGGNQKRAQTLGPLSRWLIAVDLLSREASDPSTKLHEVIHANDKLGTGSRAVKRMFGHRKGDRLLIEAKRFSVTDDRAHDQTDRSTAKLTALIVSRLNERYQHQRGSISARELLDVPVPLDPQSTELGRSPVAWFQSWLEWGVAATAFESESRQDSVTAPLMGRFQPAWASELIDVLVHRQVEAMDRDLRDQGSDDDAHEHIVNIHSFSSRQESDSFAEDAMRSIDAAMASSPRSPQLKRIGISLRGGATRLSVLEQLYDVFNLPRQKLAEIDRGDRSLDLDTDLEPIRIALTQARAVVLLEGLDAPSGRFGAMYGYVCHTNWAELLRILAQPHSATIRASDGALRPTFQLVVVSTTPVAELSPWCKAIAVDRLWGIDRISQPGLPPALASQLAQAQATRRISSVEMDLVLAMRGVEQERWVARVAARDPRKVLHEEVQAAMLDWFGGLELSEIETLIFCLIAASPNGMRRSTLERCVFEWSVLFKSDAARDSLGLEAVDSVAPLPVARRGRAESARSTKSVDFKISRLLGEKCGGVLIEIPDEEVESLTPAQRNHELDRAPRTRVAATEGRPTVVTFASPRLRALFVRLWTATDGESSAPQIPVNRFPELTWPHVNFVLAEESIRQSTSQLRHLPHETPDSAYTLRRAVQGLIHGLASLPISRASFQVAHSLSGGLYGPALPEDAEKRYRYLYVFLHRRVIEGDAWRMGRSFGRSDLRLEMLILLLFPDRVCDVLTDESGDATDLLTATAPADHGVLSSAMLSDRALWCDLVEAIGRAGCDVGGVRGGRAVEWALARLPHEDASPSIRSTFPRGPARERLEVAALKLRIDWYQSTGERERLKAAEKHCLDRLRGLGIEFVELRNELFMAADRALANARANVSGVRTDVLAAFARVQSLIESRTLDADLREQAADFLFRLGEILATRADEIVSAPGAAPSRDADPSNAFARALAIYWVADRIRSSVGVMKGATWPRASPRAMRYYVRTMLKLARLLSKEQPPVGHTLYRMTSQLLEQAQSRIAVYTRHNFQFRRERESMLTLEASRLRAWMRVLLEREFPELSRMLDRLKNAHDASPPSKVSRRRADVGGSLILERQLMESCWQLLEKSERMLFTLGFQTPHARRLLLEKVKAAVASIHLESAQMVLSQGAAKKAHTGESQQKVAAYQRYARASLDALASASRDHQFWEKIARRQEDRLIDAGRTWRLVNSMNEQTPS